MCGNLFVSFLSGFSFVRGLAVSALLCFFSISHLFRKADRWDAMPNPINGLAPIRAFGQGSIIGAAAVATPVLVLVIVGSLLRATNSRMPLLRESQLSPSSPEASATAESRSNSLGLGLELINLSRKALETSSE